MKLILASISPQKKSLLNKLGLVFTVKAAEIDESPTKDEKPEAYVRRMALEKATTVSKENPDSMVIAHDVVVSLDDKMVGKPESSQDIAKALKKLSGKQHEVISAVVIMQKGEASYQGVQKTKIKFKKLDKSQIEEYSKTEEPIGKSGGYAIQGDGAQFVESIEGSYFNVVGLPLKPLIKALQKEGLGIDDHIVQTIQMQEDSIKESFL